MRTKIFFSISLLFFISLSAWAAGADSTQKVVQPATVIKAFVDGDSTNNSAGISDVLVVRVANLNNLLTSIPGSKISDIRPFISAMEIVDEAPIGWATNGNNTDIKFLLQRTPASNATWNTLLGYPIPGPGFFYLKDTPISIGLTGKGPVAIAQNSKPFTFIRIYSGWFWGCLIFVIAYFGLLFWCGAKTSMLRDSPADLSPLGIPGVTAGCAPYSLGKVQMAFWFSIVVASYVFIWLVTDNYELINSGTLVLIGIGAGTGLGAISIGNNKADAAIAKIQALQKQQSDLRQANQLLEAAAGPGTDAKIQYNNFLDGQLTSNINDMIASLQVTKDSFFSDLLTDVNGVSFHRLQMVVFTVVLGLVFIYSVWANLTMPDFSATLLTMQGITAGTYLGFKFPEKQG